MSAPAEPSAVSPVSTTQPEKTVLAILLAVTVCHGLNDTIQSLIPSLYPILKSAYHLSFGQIGLITLTFQLTASLLQPMVGLYTDHRPQPASLAVGMGFTLIGLILLAMAGNFVFILFAAALVGLGSSVFHPEASRMARMASGGRHGFAQSLFQVGGNAGQALGPLLAAFVIAPGGQGRVAWFSVLALTAMVILSNVGAWYRRNLARSATRHASAAHDRQRQLTKGRIGLAMTVLVALMFSKFFYLASMGSYYTFYLIDRFHLPVQTAQVYLFVFMFSAAVGVILGGPIGDRFGRKYVIWVSVLGVAPFTIILPHVGLALTAVLTVVIGLILSSAASAIVVYAQELIPGRVGMITGLFFGLAFGLGGIGSAVLGQLADHTSIRFVFEVCAFLPLIGLLTVFLPKVERGGTSA